MKYHGRAVAYFLQVDLDREILGDSSTDGRGRVFDNAALNIMQTEVAIGRRNQSSFATAGYRKINE